MKVKLFALLALLPLAACTTQETRQMPVQIMTADAANASPATAQQTIDALRRAHARARLRLGGL